MTNRERYLIHCYATGTPIHWQRGDYGLVERMTARKLLRVVELPGGFITHKPTQAALAQQQRLF